MNEEQYKKRLLKRIEEYLRNNYIDYRVHREDKGIIYLFLDDQNKNQKPSMIYDVFEATLEIVKTGKIIDPCIKEKMIEQVNMYESENV